MEEEEEANNGPPPPNNQGLAAIGDQHDGRSSDSFSDNSDFYQGFSPSDSDESDHGDSSEGFVDGRDVIVRYVEPTSDSEQTVTESETESETETEKDEGIESNGTEDEEHDEVSEDSANEGEGGDEEDSQDEEDAQGRDDGSSDKGSDSDTDDDDDTEEESCESSDSSKCSKCYDSSESSEEELRTPGIKVLKGVYMVEAVTDKRVRNNTVEYLVKWLNYPASQSTWEPASHFDNNIFVEKYEQSMARRCRKRKRDESEDQRLQGSRYKAFKKDCRRRPARDEEMSESTEDEEETSSVSSSASGTEDDETDHEMEEGDDVEVNEESDHEDGTTDGEADDEQTDDEMDEGSDVSEQESDHEDTTTKSKTDRNDDAENVEMTEEEMRELEADFADNDNDRHRRHHNDQNNRGHGEADAKVKRIDTSHLFRNPFPSSSPSSEDENELIKNLDKLKLLRLQSSGDGHGEYYQAIFEGCPDVVTVSKVIAFSRWPEVVMKLQQKASL